MNRFDRVTSILLLLQTRSVVTARFLADYFGVSERTIYRDIRTLENAGVPIGAEAGVGYFLEPSYRLPPVCFTLDEAAALLLGEKLLVSRLDAHSLQDFKHALQKVRAVIDRSDKDYLSTLDADIEVFPTGSHFFMEEIGSLPDGDPWLRESRSALVHRQVVEISYSALLSDCQITRAIEPIGLFYYSWHWHLIAWCRLRKSYRDFRLDRIASFLPQAERFNRHDRLTLQAYLEERPEQEKLEAIEVLFSLEVARFVGEQRYMFGFIDEEAHPDGIVMRFLTPVPEYMARWLLQYTDGVKVLQGHSLKKSLEQLSAQLFSHWKEKEKGS